MKNKIYVGIDVSVNSTGLVIRKNNETFFYRIISQKGSKTNSPSVILLKYERLLDGKTESEKEIEKIVSGEALAKLITSTIKRHIDENDYLSVRQESSVVSVGRVLDLVMFNVLIKREILRELNPDEWYIVPPKTLKKAYTGNGNAKKDLMIETFLKDHKGFDVVSHPKAKIDDIVDAYALTVYENDKNKYLV